LTKARRLKTGFEYKEDSMTTTIGIDIGSGVIKSVLFRVDGS
jgi:activator of 2-hydroxyglutaryl-CoA dehydratase